MTRELLDLWITRLHGRDGGPPVPKASRSSNALAVPGSHLLITRQRPALARQTATGALAHRAHVDAGVYKGEPNPNADRVLGWLAIDVPVPQSPDPAKLAHRLIRRLYFTAVLHGLGERQELREAVQGMRRSYLQTRGKVTTTESEKSVQKRGAELGVTLDLLKPLTGKLSAAAELEVAESLAAEMQRLDLFEAEDQLLFDLEILAQLNAHIDRFAQISQRAIPRWETVRAFFKSVYGRVAPNTALGLRTAFVLDAARLGEAVALFEFFARATGLTVPGPAHLVVHGGPMLHRLYQADRDLGFLALRSTWDAHLMTTPVAPLTDADRAAIAALRPQAGPEVGALLDRVLDQG